MQLIGCSDLVLQFRNFLPISISGYSYLILQAKYNIFKKYHSYIYIYIFSLNIKLFN